MKIDILIPVALTEAWRKVAVERYVKHAAPDTVFQGRDMTALGITKVDYHSLSEPIVRIARRAEVEGADACIIDCFTDPGLKECSTRLSIPVIGVGLAGILSAHATDQKFAIITSEDEIVPIIEDNVHRYGVTTAMHSVVAINMPFDQIPYNRDLALDLLQQVSEKLVSEVSTFVMGCTELAELSDALCQRLRKLNPAVRVINPLKAAVKLTETLVLSTCNVAEADAHLPDTALNHQKPI